MERMWKLFEIRSFGRRFIERKNGLLNVFDEKVGIIIHYPEESDVSLDKIEEDVKKYGELKEKWGSKYLEVFVKGTEFINATVIIAVDHFGRERTVVM